MKTLAAVLSGLELLAVAVWLGGTAALAGLVAPSAFTLLPTRETAGDFMAHLFVVFNGRIALICLAIALIGFSGVAGVERIGVGRRLCKMRTAEGLILFVLLLLNLYLGRVLTPQMDAMRAALRQPEAEITAEAKMERAQRFLSFHRRTAVLFSANLALGVGLLFLKGAELSRPKD
jgi:uncharacterized membrane protein